MAEGADGEQEEEEEGGRRKGRKGLWSAREAAPAGRIESEKEGGLSLSVGRTLRRVDTNQKEDEEGRRTGMGVVDTGNRWVVEGQRTREAILRELAIPTRAGWLSAATSPR